MRAQFVRNEKSIKDNLNVGIVHDPKAYMLYIQKKLANMGIKSLYHDYTDSDSIDVGMYELRISGRLEEVTYVIPNSSAAKTYEYDYGDITGLGFYYNQHNWIKGIDLDDIINIITQLKIGDFQQKLGTI